MERKKNLIFRLWPAICAVFLVLNATSCGDSSEEHPSKDLFSVFLDATSFRDSPEEQRWKLFKKKISQDGRVPDDLKKEILAMSFNTFLKENPLKREIAKNNALCRKEKQKGDSIRNALVALKEAELQPEREKYQGKTKILTVKRLWLNGDALPWTYQSWVYRKCRFRNPNVYIYGDTEYTGKNKLDYVNVVFSDNSYKRFPIKDFSEWLLVKPGEKVEIRYIIKNYEVGTDVGCVLDKNAYDLVVGIKYVPLFK